MVASANKPVYKVLWSACAPQRCAWYFNNNVVRCKMASGRLSLLPSGTTSNESLHKELNDAFRTIQHIHQATLDLKLVVISMGKQMSHYSATNFPTTRQLDSRTVLSRCAMAPWWSEASWVDHCLSLKKHATGRSSKAFLANREARSKQRALVAEALKKKPAAHAKHSKKRTPFTLLREGSLLQAGVKRSIFKPCTLKRTGSLAQAGVRRSSTNNVH